MPTSKWEIYLSKRVGKIASADQLIRPNQDKAGCKRQIKKCIVDVNTAMTALAAGVTIWKEDASKEVLKNYIVCNDAALKMQDKFEFLQELLTQYNGVRADSDEDAKYEKEISDCINDKQPEISRAFNEWEEVSTNFVDRMNNAVSTPPPDRETATVEEGAAGGTEKTEGSKDQTSYRPKELLNIQDGINYLQSWKKTMETYFKVSGHNNKDPDMQRALFVTNLDAELTKNFEQDLNEKGEETNLTNMLAVVQAIFDGLHPLNQRRAKLFDNRQGHRTDWMTWSASWWDAWQEAGMHKLQMEEFMCIMAIYLTDNQVIKEELLKLDCDKLTWKEVRKTGRDSQTRIIAKKIANESTVNRIATNGAGGGTGGGAGGFGGGAGGKNGAPKRKIKCFKCNNNHFARECQADPAKMKCSSCGDTEAFRRNPHYTGAGYCRR